MKTSRSCVLLVLGLLASGAGRMPAARPNLVVILTDDQRFDALGANGNPHIRTPHLDKLAARSVRFTAAHAVMSLCSPSRAAILTGRYGSANGVTSLDAPLRAGERTFAQSLKAAGYRTGMAGKWHVGGTHLMLGAITADWSLILTWNQRAEVGSATAPFVELYHRRNDPAEQRNVAFEPANRALRTKLESEITRHLQKIGTAVSVR